MYYVWSIVDDYTDTVHLEGYRSRMSAAFALARKRFREYRGKVGIRVTLIDGSIVADDVSDFTMRRQASSTPSPHQAAGAPRCADRR
jgi:hypothetical protein